MTMPRWQLPTSTPREVAAAAACRELEEALSIQWLRLHIGSVDLRVYLDGAHGAIPNFGLCPPVLRFDVQHLATTE